MTARCPHCGKDLPAPTRLGGLTAQQQALLDFIEARLSAGPVPPTFDEMAKALELKSKSGIHRLVTALEERGFIRRMPNRARSIEIVGQGA